jgi:ribosomal protein S18 acetylase RimI-like enzyme
VLEGTGVVALVEGERVGLLTWVADALGRTAEIRAVAVDPGARGRGIGRALFGAAHAAIDAAGIERVWLVTTNDNAPAIHLYESLGYEVVDVRRGAIDELRRTIKPSIPLLGHGDVELHDELELAKQL